MQTWLRKAWPYLKVALGLAIMVAIGRRFLNDLRGNPDLWKRDFRLGWLALSGFLYIAGLAVCAFFWYRLLCRLEQRPTLLSAFRAYYIGHLGKYLPGKAWAVFLRVTLVSGPNMHRGVATMTTFYEVLMTMASGVLLAAMLFALVTPETASSLHWETLRDLVQLKTPDDAALDRVTLVLLSLGLFAVVGVPILPWFFNRLVHHVSMPFRDSDTAPLPRIDTRMYLEGLLLTSLSWWLLGLSLVAVLQAIINQPSMWSLANWGRTTASIGLAYVAGFVIILVPSGLGVREFFLTLFLVPDINLLVDAPKAEARALAVMAVILLRVVWTIAEVVVVAMVYWLPVHQQLAPDETIEQVPPVT